MTQDLKLKKKIMNKNFDQTVIFGNSETVIFNSINDQHFSINNQQFVNLQLLSSTSTTCSESIEISKVIDEIEQIQNTFNNHYEENEQQEQMDHHIDSIEQKVKLTKKNLICRVCGAKAFGYNFDQVTCESCKAFFRRNALRNMSGLRCRFTGHCEVVMVNRRHCTYCRLQKCFNVGMRKEWIRSEEEKQLKKYQIENNRQLKQKKNEFNKNKNNIKQTVSNLFP
ncbi:unnamed protein product [Didymodactylos carnosus]|uniref:Nuclear receptor domain-containing protein n=1 Tax=Didymodactylos carnosus TaxID=1234261 RepID=A0A8S2E6J9_9BILA|nr:unnamed protein product [Didymodactylos carnosus]CAF3840902.1 unnamed protein product [Didymodactylos carnosus]